MRTTVLAVLAGILFVASAEGQRPAPPAKVVLSDSEKVLFVGLAAKALVHPPTPKPGSEYMALTMGLPEPLFLSNTAIAKDLGDKIRAASGMRPAPDIAPRPANCSYGPDTVYYGTWYTKFFPKVADPAIPCHFDDNGTYIVLHDVSMQAASPDGVYVLMYVYFQRPGDIPRSHALGVLLTRKNGVWTATDVRPWAQS